MTKEPAKGAVGPESTLTADRLQEALDRAGMTPRAASLKAGLSHGTVAHILRKGGTETPKGRTRGTNVATLAALAEVLNCSLAYLTGESASMDDNRNNSHQSPANYLSQATSKLAISGRLGNP